MKSLLPAIAITFACTPALAQVCTDTTTALTNLSEGMNAQPAWIGLSESGAVMEMWIEPETGAWYLVAHLDSGASCLVDSGMLGLSVATIMGDPT
jgi:hypothetical protein